MGGKWEQTSGLLGCLQFFKETYSRHDWNKKGKKEVENTSDSLQFIF